MTFAEAAMIMMSGGSGNIQSLSVTANGSYEAPKGIDGFDPVYVNVPDRYDEGYEDGRNSFVTSHLFAKENHKTYIASELGVDGFHRVSVDINDLGNIKPLDVIENKTYHAADYGCDGFDPVNVNVPDKYDDGYLDGFESAMAYTSGEPDLSKQFYIYIGVVTNAFDEMYVQLNIFNSSDKSIVSRQMNWGYGGDKSFDKSITGIKWSDDRAGTITVYATAYNKSHTEKYTNIPHVFDGLTHYHNITKYNYSIGNVDLE